MVARCEFNDERSFGKQERDQNGPISQWRDSGAAQFT